MNRFPRLTPRAVALGALLGLAWPCAPAPAQEAPARDTAAVAAGQHAFDFEIGTWTMRRRRLLRPLTGSTTWVDPGPARHIVRPVWGGRAVLAELEVDSPAPHFVGSLLHLYDPLSRQWRLYWASSEDGSVSEPMVGSFTNGRGVFIDQEPYHGVAILARVVYSDITPASFRTEQSFSADGGATWELNAVDVYTRVWGGGGTVSDAVRAGTREARGAVLAAAEAMPEARYGYRPTPAQRTFGEIVLHIHDDDRATCGAIAGRAPGPEDSVRAGAGKAALVAALRRSLVFCDSALAAVSDARLGDSVSWYGDRVPRARALIGLAQDWSDHYAQLAIYLRLNGVVPPTAR